MTEFYAYRNLGTNLERNYLKVRNDRQNTTTRNTNLSSLSVRT